MAVIGALLRLREPASEAPGQGSAAATRDPALRSMAAMFEAL